MEQQEAFDGSGGADNLPSRTLILLSGMGALVLAMFGAPAKGAARSATTNHPVSHESAATPDGATSTNRAGKQGDAAKLPFRVRPDDDVTRRGFEAFYNMDYDEAIALFQRERERYPDDPFVLNHLLAVVLAKELNREGQLDASLYMGNKFLALKAPAVDPQVKNEVTNLSQRAIALANQELEKNPKDVDALFARGVARGLATVYSAVVEKHWVGALREGLGAYHDNEHVLKLDPNYSDAKLVVGAFQYIVGSLSWWQKALAFVANIHGSKTKGLALLRQAVDGGGEESIDASTILALFLAREGRYDEALALLGRDYAYFPHNFIFGLACADVLNASGKHDEAIKAYRELADLGEKGFFRDAHVARAAYSLGLELRRQKDYPAAVQAFEQAIQYPGANPGVTGAAALQAGETCDLLGQHEKASEFYKQAIALAPESPPARTAAQFLKRPYAP